LLSYAFGFGLPIILVGIFTTQILNVFKRYSTFMGYFNIFAGIFLIILGVLVFTNNVGLLMRILQF
jgi:cytochrome c-type biogenesis protein